MKRMMKHWQVLLAAVCMAFVATQAMAEPEVGKAAPEFELKDIDGNAHKLSDEKGKIVVLHFQGYQCPWDRAYQPYLNEVAEKYASVKQGEETVQVQFLAINANHTENEKALKKYHEEVKMPYPILKDPGNKVADAYAAKTTPHIFIIDQEGVLRYMGGVEKAPVSLNDVSNMDEQYLEPVLAALVKDSEPPVTSTRSKGCSIKRAKK